MSRTSCRLVTHLQHLDEDGEECAQAQAEHGSAGGAQHWTKVPRHCMSISRPVELSCDPVCICVRPGWKR